MSTTEESKEKLMNAVLELVRTTGYRRATTKKIAARAGMNEASIFRLFGGKQRLFSQAVYEKTISAEDVDLESIYREKTDSKGRLRILLTRCFELYIQQMAIYRIFMLYSDDQSFVDQKKPVFQRVQDIIDLLKEFLKKEYADFTDTEAIDLICELFFSKLLLESLYITAQADEAAIQAYKEQFIDAYTDYIHTYLTAD